MKGPADLLSIPSPRKRGGLGTERPVFLSGIVSRGGRAPGSGFCKSRCPRGTDPRDSCFLWAPALSAAFAGGSLVLTLCYFLFSLNLILPWMSLPIPKCLRHVTRPAAGAGLGAPRSGLGPAALWPALPSSEVPVQAAGGALPQRWPALLRRTSAAYRLTDGLVGSEERGPALLTERLLQQAVLP